MSFHICSNNGYFVSSTVFKVKEKISMKIIINTRIKPKFTQKIKWKLKKEILIQIIMRIKSSYLLLMINLKYIKHY
jgi:hypothetical protein